MAVPCLTKPNEALEVYSGPPFHFMTSPTISITREEYLKEVRIPNWVYEIDYVLHYGILGNGPIRVLYSSLKGHKNTTRT